MSSGPPYLGKFRGVVTDINDPLFSGRVRARVPDVLGDQESGWAMACTPFAGRGTGFFALPTVGAGVWIEFEHGDPDYPIWSGCWWGSPTDVPPETLVPPYQKVVIATAGGTSITLDDTPGIGGVIIKTATGQRISITPLTPGIGGVIIKTATGQRISITPLGLEIDNGQGGSIKMLGPQVSINNGALDVI